MAQKTESKLLRILGEAALLLERGDVCAAASTLSPIVALCEEQQHSGVVLDDECAEVARSLFERCAKSAGMLEAQLVERGSAQPVSDRS